MDTTSVKDTVKILPDYIVSMDPILESEDLFVLVQKLSAAILIGALIGLERQHSKPEEQKIFAGIRTFPLISVLGFLAALVSQVTSFWVYALIFLSYASLVTTSHIFSAREGQMGGTSEISALIAFLLGSLVFWNLIILAAIIGVITALFLSLKLQLHSFVDKVGRQDIYATIKMSIITVIILPLLPDQTYGPLNVLNPRMIWYMVILVSGISFTGYILIKLLDKTKGIAITGLVGGMISSTAVAVSFSKKAKENSSLSKNFAGGITLASTVMYPRVFLVTAVINSSLLSSLWLPLLIFTITGLILSYFALRKSSREEAGRIEFKNPFELKSSLIFGLIFGAVILSVKAAQIYAGNSGIYIASGLAGLTSVDAIVISLANFSSGIGEKVAVSAILIALISNTIIKGIISVVSGSREMYKITLKDLGIITLVSVIYLIILLIW